MTRPGSRTLACLLLLACTAAGARGAACDAESQGRVVAIGDVHGGYRQFLSILRRGGLVDLQNRWVGGCATLIQLGDLIDRGPDDRRVLDLVMALEKKAPKSRGRVIALLGNHEVMVMTGDRRYVSAASYASFAGPKSPKLRQKAYKQYQEYRKRRSRYLKLPEPEFSAADEALWMEQHPPGYVEHVDAFGPGGKYGKWIRKRDAVARVNDILFLHGGLAPQVQFSIDEINRRVASELKTFDRFREYLIRSGTILPFFDQSEVYRALQEEIEFLEASPSSDAEHLAALKTIADTGNWLTVHPDGPLWNRKYASWSEEEGAHLIDTLLDQHQAVAIVVAHTPILYEGIKFRFDGKIALIDTGLLTDFYLGGRPSALEIKGTQRKAIYLDAAP